MWGNTGLLEESQAEGAALIDGALHGDRAVHRFNVGLDQTETQAESPLGSAAVTSVKAVEYERQILRGNANAGILEMQLHSAVTPRSRYGDQTSSRGVSNGVFDKVRHDALHFFLVTAKSQNFRDLLTQFDPFLCCYRSKEFTSIADQRIEVEFL